MLLSSITDYIENINLSPILHSIDKSGFIIADCKLINRQIEAFGCIYCSISQNHSLKHLWINNTEIEWRNIKDKISSKIQVLYYIF